MENKKPIRSFQDIDIYDKISRQCYNLALAWDKFRERKFRTQPKDGTRNE
jgi:hypothetical protein